MSQQQKLEKVLNLLLSENSDQAAEILHQIIVEKARTIYESIVEEEDVEEDAEELDEAEEVGGEPNKDFTDEISSDEDEVDTDEENDGEPEGDDEDDEFGDEDDEFDDEEGEEGEEDLEDRVEDLESQLDELRAEFDALMGEEMEEPNHADLGAEMGEIENEFDDEGDDFGGEVEPAGGAMPGMGSDEQVVGEVVAKFHEKQDKPKLEKAPQAKDKKKGKKVAEETQFLSKVADTGQKGTAKLVGTGKGMTLGAEQTKSSFTNIPARKDYGGKPTKIGGNGGTGGEYGKYHGDSAKDETITDNVNVEPKKNGVKADTTAKYTGGKPAGEGFNKSPLSKKPRQ